MSTKHFNYFDKFMGETSQVFNVLSEKNRLGIFSILTYGDFTVSDIYRCLGVRQNLISHHLKVLRDNKLVESNKKGRVVFYSINREGLRNLRVILKKFSHF